MATFKEEIEAQDIALDLETKLKRLLPNNFVQVYAQRSLGGGYHVSCSFAIGRDRSEWANGIIHNDPAYIILLVYADEVSRAMSGGFELKKAGIPIIREKKAAAPELVKHIVNYFTKHKDAILALRK